MISKKEIFFVSFLLLVSPLVAQPGQIKLSTNKELAREGTFKLTWNKDSFPEKTIFKLTELKPGQNETPVVFLEGTDTGITISGKENGIFRYRVEAISPESEDVISADTITVEVKHHSLQNAFLAFSIGALLFSLTAITIVFGHRKSRKETANDSVS